VFFYVQDVRYIAVTWMSWSDECTGCTVYRGDMDVMER
jgi:hypothetical protein